jgi:tetratricopeptide (TPR) repeat protein
LKATRGCGILRLSAALEREANRTMRSIVLLSALALLASCAGPKPTLDEVAPPEIVLQTIPVGATVNVDGVDTGTTPLRFRATARTAEHKISLAREGYLATDITVTGEQVVKNNGKQVLVALRPNMWDPAKAKGINIDNASQLTRAGLDLSKAGRCAEAVAFLMQALDVDSRHPPAHKALGTCYAKLKKNTQALEEYKAYLLYAPDAPDAAKVRAIVDKAQGDIEYPVPKDD